MPSQRIKLRRGTTAQQQNFTGAEGEVTFDTDKNTLIVHDGTTKGGHVLPRDTDVKTDIDQLTDVYGILESYVGGFSGTTETYTITVAAASSGGGNVFYITGLENPHIVLTPGNRYIFDVSDSSNAGHPLYFTADDGTTNYTTGVSRIGTEGTAGAKVIFIIPADVPALKYYCSVHGLSMGNQISSVLNTPSSGGSSSLASFDISPALPTGETSWNLATDGDISITEAGNWTFTATGDGTVDLSMKGAGGGYGKDTNSLGGTGGETTGKIAVTSGDTFVVTVGSKGVQSGGAGTYGGGGAGGNLTLPGSGGGYSGIFEGTEQQSKSILIAGGGGGGHGWDAGSATGNGGSGGGADGTAGTAGSSGGGATQTGGGAGAGNGTSGTPLTGGTGGNRSTNQGSGGGGGGGYFGGGGGAAGSYNGNQNGTPGGGGSGYIGGTSNFAVTDGVTTAGGGSTTEVDGTFSMVGQVATTEETPTVTTPTIISNSYGTVLHVTTDGAAGVNADFADSSTTAATVTAGGNSVQLSTFSPYRHGGYSTYFDGTDGTNASEGYLSLANSTNFGFGTGDFTIEAWVYFIERPPTSNGYRFIFSTMDTSDTVGVNFGTDTSGEITFTINQSGASDFTANSTGVRPEANQWMHLALVKNSGTVKIYQNGQQIGSDKSSTADTGSSRAAVIGAVYTNLNLYGPKAYISDLRVVKGTAVYTADFTPPTEALTAITDTALLTCNTPYIKETISGIVTTEPTGPYDRVGYDEDLHGGSVYFDQTGISHSTVSRMQVGSASPDYDLSSGGTVEAWVYLNSYAGGSLPDENRPIWCFYNTSYNGVTKYYSLNIDNNGYLAAKKDYNGFGLATSTTKIPLNTWTHVVFTTTGASGTNKFYVNGKDVTSTFTSFAGTGISEITLNGYFPGSTGNNDYELWVGAIKYAYNGKDYIAGMDGYISDFRVFKGDIVYSEDFTPPLSLLSSTDSAAHIKGVEGHIIDKAQSDNRLTLVGNTVASIAESKYAGSSIYFDGTGDYVSMGTDLSNLNTDFTVEGWFNFSALSTHRLLIDCWASGVNGAWQIYWRSTGSSITFYETAGGVVLQDPSASTISTNTWHHIAVSRSGSTIKLFVDGQEKDSATYSTELNPNRELVLGAQNSTGTNYFQGYMEDVRITKGLARYTEDFTPPTESLDLYTETSGTTEETTGPIITTYNLLSDSSKTELLITTDGEAGVNSSFTDSSSNATTITAGGTPQLNTFSPYRHGGYSTHFDGTGDYLSMPSAEGFKFGTGDFTIEGWVNFNISNTTKWHTPIDCWQGTNNYNWLLNLKADTFAVALGNNGAYSASHTHQVTISPSLSAGNWYHFAVTRESGSLRHFINGIQQGSTISSGANISDNIPVAIGINQDGGQNGLDGHLSDIRIVKGTALYTADFTPPTERLTAIDGTELLTCHLPYIVDGSTNSHIITLNGDVHTKANSPYDHIGYIEGTHGGSIYFDGNGDYLSLPANDDYNFGSNDFTLEAWAYVDLSSISSNDALPLVGWDTGSYKIIRLTSTGINVESDSPSNVSFTAPFASSPQTKTWNHIALVRSGNSFTAYLNGKGGTAYTSYTGNVGNGSDTLNISYKSDPQYYTGNISDLRITKGTAVYTADFTPPTTPLESTNAALHIKGVEGHIIDKAQSGIVLELGGNVAAATGTEKYSTSNIVFDGSGDYIRIPYSDSIMRWWDDDYTMEYWIRPSSFGQSLESKSNFMTHGDIGGTTDYWSMGPLANGTVKWFWWSGTSNAIVTTTALSVGTWHHLAFTYEKATNTATIYIDGVASGSATVSNTPQVNSSYPLNIGHGAQGAAFDGRMEDFRISNRLVYTEDFTVPNAALEAPQIVQSEGSYTVATGGTITTDGNYKYHTFTEDGTFSITNVGTNTTVDVLAVGGGGAGGGSYDSNAGGGGAGGYLEGSITAEVQSYDIIIGQGGVGASQALGTNGGNTTISVLNATALGGGYGGGSARATHAGGGDGGSGGGGAGFPSDAAGGAALQGDSGGLTGYGNAGGSIGSYSSDGGGGAGQAGGTNANSAGGDGRQWLDGNYYAGGGSGGAGGLAGGLGGGGAGSNGSGNGANATANTGGGGGGAYANPGPTTGGNGGSGVVIFRYPYQGTVTETAPTSTSYRYMKVVLNSVGSGTQAQVTEVSFTGENGATDFITGQTITDWYGTGSTATSQSPTIALVNNAQSPANSEHTNLETLPFTLEYDLGASYVHGTQLRYLQLGSSDSPGRYPASVTVYGATQPDFSDEVALITNSAQAYASVNSNTLIDLGTSITGGSAGSATFSDLLAVTSHPINVYDDAREQRETTNAFSGTHSLYINFAGSTRRSPQDTSGYTYTDYTISFWARMESWNTYNGTRINWLTNGPKRDESNSHGDGAIYVVDNSNEVGFVTQRYNGSLYHNVSGTASSSFATDAWYHFVVTGDATNNTATLTVSSDGGTFGDMINSSTFTTGNQVATLTPQNLYLAGSSGNAANGAHQIRYDLYGIWDRVLDATERQAVFDAGATHDHPNLPTSGLKLYYTFDDDYNNYSNS